MRIELLCLFLALHAGVLLAQPVDLLQQLYGKKPLEKKLESEELIKPVPSESVSLSFRDRFEASRERIFFADLVQCKGSKSLCKDLAAIDVGAAPKPMRQERVSRSQIAALVERDYPGLALSWEGTDAISVMALSTGVNEEAVMKVISEEFEDAPAGMRVIIQSIRVPSLPMLRHSNYSYKLSEIGDQISRVFTNPRTRFAQLKMIAVDQDPASQSKIEFLVQVSLRIEVEALVMKDAKERGESVTEGSIELQWINYQDQVFADPKQVIGKLLKTRIQSQSPIRTWDLTREPEVLRGDRVEAMLSSNGLKINGVAQALEQGFIGQKIRIRLESTKKTIVGTVVARSQVEVPSL